MACRVQPTTVQPTVCITIWLTMLMAGCSGAADNAPPPAPEGESIAALSALEKSSAASAKKPVKQVPSSPASAPARSGQLGLPMTLTRNEIQQAMRGIARRVQACYDHYRIAGTVYVRMRVLPNGTAHEIQALGPLGTSDTGKCLTEAARQATFPPFRGEPLIFDYPFILH